MNNQLAIRDVDTAIDGVKLLCEIVRQLRADVFIEDQDFGKIPGTGEKPVLLLPGMEKLMRALRLLPEYIERYAVRDFDKPLFYFEIECRLIEIDTGLCVSTAVGSANSYEAKWRWREAKRACPKCGATAINRSKYPPRNQPNAEPGWYCYAKIGGCGAEYAADDAAITGQQIGRMENPDIFDQVNTIVKIAQKRALGSAIKGAANVSEFFTVDLEDLPQHDLRKPLPADADASRNEVIEATYEEVPASTVVNYGDLLDAAYDATKHHFRDFKHFMHLIDKLYPNGVAGMTLEDVVSAINANRESEGKANVAWWNDKEAMKALTKTLREVHHTDLSGALQQLQKTMKDFRSADELLDALNFAALGKQQTA